MNKAKIALLFLVIFLVGGYFFTTSHPTKTANDIPKTLAKIKVQASPVKREVINLRIEALGSLRSQDIVDISPQIAGEIAHIYFKPGSFVKKGAPLIKLDDTVYQSELAAAKAKLQLSKMNYQRIEQLSKRRLSSEQELDQALADLRDNQNTVKVKQAELAKLTLRAPFSGTLSAKKISVGQYVSVGQPLVKLVANQKLIVEYSVPERYLPDLQIGQKVKVQSDTFSNLSFDGKVDYISPTIDIDTRSIQVEAIIDNKKQELSPGLFVKITHLLGRKRESLLVPEASLVSTINGQKVYTVIDDKANSVDIVTGAHHQTYVEVLSGLHERDTVITRGQHKLKEGSLIKVIKSSEAS